MWNLIEQATTTIVAWIDSACLTLANKKKKKKNNQKKIKENGAVILGRTDHSGAISAKQIKS